MVLHILAMLVFVFINIASIEIAKADIARQTKIKKSPSTKKKANISQTVRLAKSSLKRSEVEVIKSEQDKKNAEAVESYLNSRKLGISDYTKTFDVLTGTTLKGVVLNSIVSSNLESPILVQVTQSNCDIAVNSKIICTGTTRGKRVLSSCLMLISNSEEFPLNASLLNLDGSAGLTGDVYTGKEELVAGAIVGGALSAALDVSRDRVSTATGELATNSRRNKVITGAMGGLDEAVQVMGDEAKNKETKISIDAGKEVLIFINQRFKI